jgi:hypothetical protein
VIPINKFSSHNNFFKEGDEPISANNSKSYAQGGDSKDQSFNEYNNEYEQKTRNNLNNQVYV